MPFTRTNGCHDPFASIQLVLQWPSSWKLRTTFQNLPKLTLPAAKEKINLISKSRFSAQQAHSCTMHTFLDVLSSPDTSHQTAFCYLDGWQPAISTVQYVPTMPAMSAVSRSQAQLLQSLQRGTTFPKGCSASKRRHWLGNVEARTATNSAMLPRCLVQRRSQRGRLNTSLELCAKARLLFCSGRSSVLLLQGAELLHNLLIQRLQLAPVMEGKRSKSRTTRPMRGMSSGLHLHIHALGACSPIAAG